eukprot:GHVH01017324.1.p2 GENE.GHVH01017324.1~~GHVH01017324.1.p2  ORF type:complete len:261 (-),score=55.36 GHVH01017324.1:1059-1841(-)
MPVVLVLFNQSGGVLMRTDITDTDSLIAVSIRLSPGSLSIYAETETEEGEEEEEEEGKKNADLQPPILTWRLVSDIDPPEESEHCCFLLHHVSLLDSVVLCPPSIRLRDFWMIMIEQMILCTSKNKDGRLRFHPSKSSPVKDSEEESLEEQSEVPPKKIIMEVSRGLDGAIPNVSIDGVELKFEADVAALEMENETQMKSINHHTPPPDRNKVNEREDYTVEAVLDPLEQSALDESLASNHLLKNREVLSPDGHSTHFNL